MIPEPKVICGDCNEVMPTLAAASIDLVVTSPPYPGMKRSYGQIKPDDYVRWILPSLVNCWQVLKPTGNLCLNVGYVTVGGQRHSCICDLERAMRDWGWLLIDHYIWAKHNPMPGKFGKRAVPAWESIFWWAKTKDHYWDDAAARTPYASKPHVAKPKSTRREPIRPDDPMQGKRDFYKAGGALGHNWFWEQKAGKNDGAGDHDAVFPDWLPRYFIRCGSPVGGMVLDPYAGHGTTGKAALWLQRECLLIEKDEAFAADAKRRLRQEYKYMRIKASQSELPIEERTE